MSDLAGQSSPYDLSPTEQPGTSDPFAESIAARPRQTHFAAPPSRPSPHASPFESTASLPHEFGGRDSTYESDYDEEKLPLTGGHSAGGFYPPG